MGVPWPGPTACDHLCKFLKIYQRPDVNTTTERESKFVFISTKFGLNESVYRMNWLASSLNGNPKPWLLI